MGIRFMRVLLDPGSEAGLGQGTQADTQGVSPPPADMSSSGLPSFGPDPGPSSAQDGSSSTAAPGAGGSLARPAVPGDPNLTAVGGTGQAPQEWQSIRDAAQRFGYAGLANFQDDEAALVHLVQQAQRAQQADVYSRLGQAIAPDIQQYQAWRDQRQAAAPAQAQPSYAPPPFDEKWMSLVDQDQGSGMYYAKPGVNPAVAEAVNKRVEWQQQFQRDPVSFMDKYAESKIPSIVQQQVSQALEQMRRDQSVNSILSANETWLYQKNQAGQFLQGPNGRVPTPEGSAYINQVRSLQQAGITDPVQQDAIARQLVAGQLALARVQQSNGQSPSQQTAQATYRPSVNQNQARPPLERQQTPGSVEPDNAGLSLHEMMSRAFAESGIDDATFQQQVGF